MANSKIYLGNTNVGSLFRGASNVSIYLGENKVYPLYSKFQATYSGGLTYQAFCDDNSTLTTSNTKPSGYDFTAMTEAVIGDCVTKIKSSTFSGCTSLTSVTIPTSVISIGNASISTNVFTNCASLTNINIPNSVTFIGSSAFKNCSNLISLTIPDSVESIGAELCNGCTNLRYIEIGSGITSFGITSGNETKINQSCPNLEYISINALTPPNILAPIQSSENLSIYVPDASLDAYKSGNWSSYANIIKPMSEKPS